MALSNGPDKPFTAQDAAQRAYNNDMAASVFDRRERYRLQMWLFMPVLQALPPARWWELVYMVTPYIQ
ncbi:hypothetical protein A9R56_20770 [Escherichia coli]|nr:hypothetical protein A9R56_20770 [Escherichia coli]